MKGSERLDAAGISFWLFGAGRNSGKWRHCQRTSPRPEFPLEKSDHGFNMLREERCKYAV